MRDRVTFLQRLEGTPECPDDAHLLISSEVSKLQNITRKVSDLETSNFDRFSVKTTLNSLGFQQNPFLERSQVFPENSTVSFV